VGTGCPDEGNACTQDACDGAGICAHDAVPATGCRTAQKSLLLLKDNADNAKDQLTWKWVKGQPTSQTELSNPTTTADYTLCVYDANGIVTSATVPADATKWSPISDKGYKYKDTGGAEDGITNVLVKGSTQDKSKAKVKGKGLNLPDPTLGNLPLPVTAQLRNEETEVCLEAVYDSAQVIKNDTGQFKAKVK
jgi:hypothetical protein